MSQSIFRRLRLKFIVISMSMLLVFLLTVCIAVYCSMSYSLSQRNEAVLDYTAELIRTGHYIQGSSTSNSPPAADRNPTLLPGYYNPSLNDDAIRKQSWALLHGGNHLDAILLEQVMVLYTDSDCKIQRILKNGIPNSDYTDALGVELETFLHAKVGEEGTVKFANESHRYKCYTIDGQSIFLMVSCESDQISSRQLMLILSAIGVLSILVLLCFCYYLSGRAIKPLEQSWKQQQQFLHDASHELKTPLAVISTNIEAVRSCPGDTIAKQDKWLSYIADEAEDMRNLVNDMLTLAKGDTPTRNDRVMVTFSLSDMVTEAGLLMEANALEAGILLDTDVEENIEFIGNPDDIKHLLLILLDNALKNTFEGGSIDLALHRNRDELLITCYNTGRGIPASELQNIFRRFYRVDPSRARLTGGSGLGLSIAERIVGSYKGKIWAESEEGKWARFHVKLPAIKE